MRVRPMESESSHSGYRPKVRHRASQREVMSKERKALLSLAFHNTDKFGWYRCLADGQNVVGATKPKTSADWQAPQKNSKGPLNCLACSCRLCCHWCHRNFEGKGYVVPYTGEMGAWRTATGEGRERYDGIFHGIFGVLSSYTSTLSPKSALGRPDSLRCVTYI